MANKKKIILAVGALVVLGGAAIAAVGHREGRMGHRGHDGHFDVAQMGDAEGRGRWRGGERGERGERGGPGMREMEGMGRDSRGHRMQGSDRDMRPGWFRRGVTADEFEARTRERFARLDKNSDGVIDAGEVEAVIDTAGERGGRMREWMARRAMGRADANRDGSTTRAEVLDRVKRDFSRMDLDGDGRISDADLPPTMRGRDALKNQSRGMMGGGMLGRLMAADANRDGIVTLDEVIAESGRRFDLADRNKDGVLDAADRDSMRKEMSEYRVRRFMHMHGAKDGRVTRDQFFATAKERFAERDMNSDGRVDRDDMRPRRRGPAQPDASTPDRK